MGRRLQRKLVKTGNYLKKRAAARQNIFAEAAALRVCLKMKMEKLQHLHTAVLTNLQHTTGAFAKYAVQRGFIISYGLIFHEGLDGSGEAAAVDAADAIFPKDRVADRQGHGHVLVGDIMVGVYILEIFERGISGSLYVRQEGVEILCLQSGDFLLYPHVLGDEVDGT